MAQGRIDRYPEGGFVESQIAPGGYNVKRLVRSIAGLSSTGKGTEIGLGNSGEVAIYADMAIDVYLHESQEALLDQSILRFSGRIGKIYARKRTANDVGRLVIYTGVPSLGVGWKRPDGRLNPIMDSGATGVNWGAGLTSVIPLGLWNMASTVEGFWIKQISMIRSGGTIEGIGYVEIESGAAQSLFRYYEKSPTNILNFTPAEPFKLSTNGGWTVYGSAVGAATTIDVHLIGSWQW